MSSWLLFALILIAGIGMLAGGIYYMRKEQNDPESVKIYRVAAVIGAVLAVAAVVYRIMA